MSIESGSRYNKLPEHHEAVTKFQPRFLARGGDHLVYEVSGHPDTVIKASTFTLMDVLEQNAEKGVALDSFPEQMTDWSGHTKSPVEETRTRNAQIQNLRAHFGRDHTLAERRFFMKVPVTRELLAEIFENDVYRHRSVPGGVETLDEVWSSVVVQERASVLTDENAEATSLNFGSFVEQRKGDAQVPPEYVNALNEALVLGVSTEEQASENRELLLTIQDGDAGHSLATVLAKAQQDPLFKVALVEFLGKAISYANETGNILAMAGQDNVLFHKKDGAWSYLLVDAIPVHSEAMFAFAKDAIHRFASGEDIWQGKSAQEVSYDKQIIMKTLNFVRTINGLAGELGVPERLELVSAADKGKVDLVAIST